MVVAQQAVQVKAHVAEWKKKEVQELTDLLTKSKVIAVVNISGIPSGSLQEMRKKLRATATMKSGKINLFHLALKEAGANKEGLNQLDELVQGQVCLVTTDANPFKLFRQMEATKQKVAAKGGEKAPDDIWIRKGETPFKPGPVVGELQKSGIPAAIDQGKVVIKSDKLLVKRGDEISRDLALAMAKLEIFPIEIGLDLRAAFEDGLIYKPDVLRVSEDEMRMNFINAIRGASEIAMRGGWVTKFTIEPMLVRAQKGVIAVAGAGKLAVPDDLKDAFAKVYLQMVAFAKLAKGEKLTPEEEAAIGGMAAAAPAAGAPAEAKAEEKKEEKVSEEEAAAGLGALFGE